MSSVQKRQNNQRRSQGSGVTVRRWRQVTLALGDLSALVSQLVLSHPHPAWVSYLSSPHPPLPWPPHLKFSREGGARQSSSGAAGYEDIFKYLSSRWHRNSLSRSWHRKYICGSCWQTREVIIENKIDHTIYTATRLAVRTTWTVMEVGSS